MHQLSKAVFSAFILFCSGISSQTFSASPEPLIIVSYAPIVKKAAPAVVSISNVQKINIQTPLFSNDPFFNFFFGDNPHLEEKHQQKLAKSLGSGVIIDPKGIVVTCAHVVDKADKIIVQLSDNREFIGKIMATDLRNDLAIIQLQDVNDNHPLPALSLEETPTEVGDSILAIGNPFGIGQTVTSGIISAIARNVQGRILLQTDASINPGNSGGALVSLKGNLIGIPNAILSKTGASHGIGFAIPHALIRILLDSVKNKGIIRRPWAGITVQRLTPDLAKSLDLPIPQGVVVTELHPSSPAQNHGLKQGNVITAINGQSISTPEDFIYQTQAIPFGQEITLTLGQNQTPQDIKFQAIEPPATPAPNNQRIRVKGSLMNDLEIANLSPALVSKYQLPLGMPEKGVVIVDTGKNMLARQLNLKSGDLIEQINQIPVNSVDELLQKLSHQKEYALTLRQGSRRIEINNRP